jgi:hypothetical protein
MTGDIQREVGDRGARAAVIALRYGGGIQKRRLQDAISGVWHSKSALGAVGIADQVRFERSTTRVYWTGVHEHDRDAEHGSLHGFRLAAKGRWCRLKLFASCRRRTECCD